MISVVYSISSGSFLFKLENKKKTYFAPLSKIVYKKSNENLGEEKKSKRKKFNAGWMDRMGEDPDKPLKESSAGMEIDESELRTYNDGNPKVTKTLLLISETFKTLEIFREKSLNF